MFARETTWKLSLLNERPCWIPLYLNQDRRAILAYQGLRHSGPPDEGTPPLRPTFRLTLKMLVEPESGSSRFGARDPGRLDQAHLSYMLLDESHDLFLHALYGT